MTSLLRPFGVGVFSAALVGLAAAGVLAQTAAQAPEEPPAEPPPGYIVSVEGSAVLERDNTTGDAITGMPLLVGDRLRSEGGALEIKWAERSDLKLARYTELDVLSRTMVRVPRGKVTITLVTPPGQSVHDQLAIDAPSASVRFYAAGEYLVTVGGTETPEVELAVIRGSAQLASDRGQTMIAAGERALVRDGSIPTGAETYDVASMPRDGSPDGDLPPESTYDPTDDLAAFQRSSAGGAYQGTPYLPTELYGYESVLGSAGSWESDPAYGYVWYPRVAADWRPYYRGRWHHVPRYGWTWLGAERWAYPTHHYGRWGFGARGRWFWRPSRTWGPAWVSWAVAPSYVGWCPLGWDGRPVFAFYNFSTTVVVSRGRDPWRGWTVVPSRRLGYRYDVPRYRVDHRRIVRERPAFITARAAPRHPGRGVVSEDGNRRAGGGPRGRSSGVIPPSPGYSGYFPGGNAAGARTGAVPRDRNESPYDRARRVMDRRAADGRRGDGVGATTRGRRTGDGSPGMSGPGVVAPGGSVPQGSYDDGQRTRGAYPRYGTSSRPSQRGGRNVSPSDSSGSRRNPSAAPSRRSPGMSRPPSADYAPGMSRPRSSDDGARQRQYVPRSATRPDADRRDDGGRRRAGRSAVPRHANPDRGRDGSSGPPARASAPRGGDRGGDRGRDRGGDRGGGRAGSSNGGGRSSDGGGAVRRHPR